MDTKQLREELSRIEALPDEEFEAAIDELCYRLYTEVMEAWSGRSSSKLRTS